MGPRTAWAILRGRRGARATTVSEGHATFAVSIPPDPQLRGLTLYPHCLLFGRGAPGRIGSTTRALKAAIF